MLSELAGAFTGLNNNDNNDDSDKTALQTDLSVFAGLFSMSMSASLCYFGFTRVQP